MVSIGTPLSPSSSKLLLLGAGELGKEVAICAQRLGIEVIAVDSYANAPAMQVAHHYHVVPMLDAIALSQIIESEKPTWIVPEIEAIATEVLLDLEARGYNIIPNAKTISLTMDRIGIRRLAAEELQLPTSDYRFAYDESEYIAAVEAIGFPCIVKPIMSSSGKGQSLLRSAEDVTRGWFDAVAGARGKANAVIIESLIEFDYEITLLTVRHSGGTAFCEPIGHNQVDGDYRQSWQPQPMQATVLEKAQAIAHKVTDALGGYGIFGVELFIKGDQVYFSEVSPRPHDTGMVTLISQNLSEFALHTRALIGLPINNIKQLAPAASCVIIGNGKSEQCQFSNIDQALAEPDTDLRLFGKPNIDGERRLGVGLALGDDLEQALEKAQQVANNVEILY